MAVGNMPYIKNIQVFICLQVFNVMAHIIFLGVTEKGICDKR